MHAGARSVMERIMRQGYYWPTMHRDAKEEVDKCDSCQIHAPVPRLSKARLTSIMSSWPFGLPRVIVTDNGTQLVNDPFKSWCEKWKIKQMNTAVAHPQANGLFNEAQNEEEIRLNLDLIQERRETEAIREAKYKKKVEQNYNKRARLVSFRVRDFVYRRNEASRVKNQGKLGLNWEGSYRVVEAHNNGSYKLCTMNDREVPRTWHAINLRNCFM
ncbi:reverse transcriptase domain-containing protein [Tanacetum coccineum]